MGCERLDEGHQGARRAVAVHDGTHHAVRAAVEPCDVGQVVSEVPDTSLDFLGGLWHCAIP